MNRIVLLAVLCWMQVCRAGWWESWHTLRELEQGLLALGETHLCWVDREGHRQEHGLPAGALACMVEEPASAWILDGEGAWRQLRNGTWQAVWSDGRLPRQCVAGTNPPRVVVYNGHSIAVYGLAERPFLQWELPVPGLVVDQLRLDPVSGGIWFRAGASLYQVREGSIEAETALPFPVADWSVYRGRVLLRDQADHLRNPDGRILLPDRERVRQLFREADGVRVLCRSNRVFHFGEGELREESPLVPYPGESPDWVGSRLAVFNGARTRRVHQRSALSSPLARMYHGGKLLQRLPWGNVDWMLERNGTLRRGAGGDELELGQWTAARSLHPAGPGPVLLCEGGLQSFLWSGTTGGWIDEGGTCAAALEDWLLVGSAEGLRVYWTNEEEPRLEYRENSGAITGIEASARWCVLRRESFLELWDLELPWQPRRLDLLPLAAEKPFTVLEDRLLVGGIGLLQAYTLSSQGITPVAEPCVRFPASSWVRRGADRLLSLDHEGRLRQLRLRDNLPRRVEWDLRLELAGRLSLRQDGLQVLGSGGVLVQDLPPLPMETAPAIQLFPARALRSPQVLARTFSGERLRLYDLLGRHLGEWAAEGFRPDGLARGRYLAVRLDSQGQVLSREPMLVLP